MLTKTDRYKGQGSPDYGFATAIEAAEAEQKELRVKRLIDTGHFNTASGNKAGPSTSNIMLRDLIAHYDEITAAMRAADAQFDADNADFLKKYLGE